MKNRELKIFKSLHSDNSIDRIKDTSFVKAVLVLLFIAMSSLTKLYADNEKLVISRHPAGATYSENANARFYVNAYSTNSGYLTYKWFCSAPFDNPVSTTGTYTPAETATIKAGATPLLEGVAATLITTTPTVDDTKYYYYWVEITNVKDGDTCSIESAFAQTKIVNRELPDHITNGDFSTVYAFPGTGVAGNPMIWGDYGRPTTGGWFTTVAQIHLPNWKTTDYYVGFYEIGGVTYPTSSIPGFGDVRQSFQVFCLNKQPFGYRVNNFSEMIADPVNPVLVTVTDPVTATVPGDQVHMEVYTKHGDRGGDTGNFGAIELSNSYPSSVYQEIATVPGKIYEWSLDHTARRSLNTDIAAVVMGAAINEQSELGADYALWENDGIPELNYPYGASSADDPKTSPTYFYKIVDALAKRIVSPTAEPADLASHSGESFTQEYNNHTYYVYIIATGNVWTTYSGVYTIPAGQGTTVFSFIGIRPTNSSGNVLDNIVFASGAPLDPSTSITYGNDVSLSTPTTANYAYGIVEVRGSSVSLVADAMGYYDPDGGGASSEVAISKTAGLGIDGWYSTYGANSAFTNTGVITFKNLVPGKTYRIVGIPKSAVNTGLHTNETPEYVFDEGYYEDIQTKPAFEGNSTTVWNVDVDTYIDSNGVMKARIIVKNARADVEYALLADDGTGTGKPSTTAPAHANTGWTPGTAGYATFDTLNPNTYYYLVARPYGYDEVTYTDAAYDIDGVTLTPAYIKIRTPGINEGINKDDVSRSNCLSITLANSQSGYIYAVVDPETGKIIGATQNGTGYTLTFTVPEATKTYQIIITKSDEANWFRGVSVYGCLTDNFTIDYLLETVKSSQASGNIPTNIEYNIRGNDAGSTWIVGDLNNWTVGMGTQPVNLSTKILAGNTKSILDSLQSLDADATLYYRGKNESGYTGQSITPVKEIVIPKRPPAPVDNTHYDFDFDNEEIDVLSSAGSLLFSQINSTSWTGGISTSWTFVDAGWDEGASERPFNVRVPAINNTAFASVIRTDTIPARPEAPNVGIMANNNITEIVITNMTPNVEYQYQTGTGISTSWTDYTPSGTQSNSIPFTPTHSCFVRFAATADAPASFITVLASPLSIQSVHFMTYTYGSAPVSATVVISSGIAASVNITSLELDGDNSNSQYYDLTGPAGGDYQVPGYGNNTKWTLTPKNNLNAGTYNTQLKLTYTYNSTPYTAYSNVYLTVEKAPWNMGIHGEFDVSQTKAQQLVLDITGAPAGAWLSYYNGTTPVTGNPEDLIPSDGAVTHTFTAANGLQPGTTYDLRVLAREDQNHYESDITVLAPGYTAYATPVFADVIYIDYINEHLTYKQGYSPADYTLACSSCSGAPVIASPYSLFDILENNNTFELSIIHNAGVNPPYPASEPGYSGNITGRGSAPAVDCNTTTPASNASTSDGKISIAGQFQYRIHGAAANWSSASAMATGLSVGDYDVRYSASSTSFASKLATVTILSLSPATIVPQPTPLTVVKCCIHDTLTVTIPTTANTVSYQWYQCDSPSKTGSQLINGAMDSRFAIPIGLSVVGPYYYYCKINVGGCPAYESEVATVTVVDISKKIASVTPSSVSCAGNINLTFDGTSPHEVYYTVNNGVNISEHSFVATGNNTTIVADFVGEYTFKYMLNGYVCTCAPEFTVTVNPGASPTINISGITDICYGMSTTLTASASVTNPVFRWYRSKTDATPFHTGATYTTSNLTADSTFYVSVSGVGICENLPGDRKEVTVALSDPSTQGKDFYLSFGQNIDRPLSSITMQIRIVAQKTANVDLTFKNDPFPLNTSVTVAAGSVYTRNLNANEKAALFSNITGTTSKSLRIQSDEPVSVYALNQSHQTTDATYVLPVDVLGTDYYHISYMPISGLSDGYTIVATEDETNIYENGSPKAVLQSGEVYSYYYAGDMTGYHITSSKPVAYFVTNQLVNVPNTHGARDHLYEQMTPVNSWGKTFVVPVTHRGVERVRIVASQDGTVITQSGGVIQTVAGGQTSLNLNKGQFVELEIKLETNGCYISSNKPVGVASYLVGNSYAGNIGDPSLTIVPPIEQMVFSANIAPFIPVGNTDLVEHYVMVITPAATKELTTVTIGNNPPTTLSGTWTAGNGAGTGNVYSFYTMKLTNADAAYHFANPNGLLVMGFGVGGIESYCYLSGAAIRTLEAAFYVNDNHYLDLNGETLCVGSEVSFASSSISVEPGATGYLKWYIDDVEQTDKTDNIHWTGSLTNGSHTVRIDVTEKCRTYSFTTTFTVINTSDDITAKDTTICYNTKATLTASSSVANPVFRWYASQTETTPFHTGASYTTSALIADTTLYISVEGTDVCENLKGNRKAVKVTVDLLCAKTDNVTTSCDNMPVTIPVLANDIFGCMPVTVSVETPPSHGSANVDINNNIIYTGNFSGIDSLTYKISCGGNDRYAKVYLTINASNSAFVDDLWYFGQNLAGVDAKSPGIRFVKDEFGQYVAQDASGESKVNSWENSLVVSSPYCNGQNIFYSSHDKLYNSLHETMQNGAFEGNSSVADGLAACYMGENKYLFFAVTKEYPNAKALIAYVVDMNADNGKGARTAAIEIEPAHVNMSETVALIARAGTSNQYWLIYAHCNNVCSGYTNDEFRVRLIDVSAPDPIGMISHSIGKTPSATYTITVSQQYNRIAITNFTDNSIDIFDFDNSTGILSNQRNIPNLDTRIYGIEFSPDGNQFYCSAYRDGSGSVGNLYQYDISGTTPVLVADSPVKYWAQTINETKGGGLKLGPDGNIYVTLAYSNKVGVISNPNDAITSLETRYDSTALELSVTYNGLQFSTGLTKPAIMACNMNNAPATQPDSTEFCASAISKTATKNVLFNDTDIDAGETVFLTNATFVDPSDEDLATLTVNAADSTVTLTLKSGVTISATHIFNIIYNVKDNGLPASQCATGRLKITAHPTPNFPDIRVRVCPNLGDINLSKYLDTINGVKTNDIQWTSQISGIPITSPAGAVSTNNFHSANVYTFMYTISSMCVTEQMRKVYLDVLKNSRQPKLRDTVVICYKYAEAIQLNQLFGIEAPGTWIYPTVIESYIRKSTSPVHNGATVMDGKGIYKDVIPSLEDDYHGRIVKIVDMTYKTDDNSCLHGKKYTVAIVLTDDIL
jgi:hypothetical protein